MPLRVVPAEPGSTECIGCSRRALLQGLAVTTVSVFVGCTTDDGGLQPDAGPGAAVTMCGNNLCIDLNNALNAALVPVAGSLVITAPHDWIIIVRVDATTFKATSDICTHAGCAVHYDKTNQFLLCPCHGSRFSLTGAVLRGPAGRSLASYPTMLDAGTNVLTIVLP